jgi:3,4-dihydroxy-2-butanone 4-phosphate synthase
MTETRLPFCSVEEAAEEIRQGRMIVLVDDEDRENEGDLTMAAEKITRKRSISWPNTAAG